MIANESRFTPSSARTRYVEYMEKCSKIRTSRLGSTYGQQILNLSAFLVERTS